MCVTVCMLVSISVCVHVFSVHGVECMYKCTCTFVECSCMVCVCTRVCVYVFSTCAGCMCIRMYVCAGCVCMYVSVRMFFVLVCVFFSFKSHNPEIFMSSAATAFVHATAIQEL